MELKNKKNEFSKKNIYLKRIIAIFLLGLLLFNTLGHYPVYLGVQWQNKVALEARLDQEDIDDEEVFTVKIPFALPYTQSTELSRIDGHFSHNGADYVLYQQRIENDTLHLMCVKDYKQVNLMNRVSDFVKMALGDSPASHQKTAKILEVLSQDYMPVQEAVIVAYQTFCIDSSTKNFQYLSPFQSISPLLATPPPRT